MVTRPPRPSRSDRGFTLIELMIVMVVLGILAGLALLGVGGFQTTSVAAACRSEIDSLKTANAAYFAREGTDAPNSDALVDGDFLERAPRYVTITSGVTDPATDAACDDSVASSPTSSSTTSSTTTSSTTSTSSTTTSTTSSTTSTTTLVNVGISNLVGTSATVGGNYQTTIVVTISPAISGVRVSGIWTDGRTANWCNTVAGVCTISTTHNTGTSSTWNANPVSSVPGAYQAGTNAKTRVTCTMGTVACSVS